MSMKVHWIVPLVLVLFVNGCTYHGQVRRGIYNKSASSSPINASVLVLADKGIPLEMLITDTENSDTQSFLLKTKDGVTAAVTDALGTLFKIADAGDRQIQNQYNFVADVRIESGLTRNSCEGELAKWAVRKEGLCTILTISLRHPDGTAVTQAKATQWQEFRTPGFASSVRWVNKHTWIFAPILTPIYMQSQGNTLRQQFEDNLTNALTDIISQLEEKRTLFDALM